MGARGDNYTAPVSQFADKSAIIHDWTFDLMQLANEVQGLVDHRHLYRRDRSTAQACGSTLVLGSAFRNRCHLRVTDIRNSG
jgi:hypothetical protein